MDTYETLTKFIDQLMNLRNEIEDRIYNENKSLREKVDHLESELIDVQNAKDDIDELLNNSILSDDLEPIKTQALRLQSYTRGEFTTFDLPYELNKLIELIFSIETQSEN